MLGWADYRAAQDVRRAGSPRLVLLVERVPRSPLADSVTRLRSYSEVGVCYLVELVLKAIREKREGGREK